VYRRRIVAGLLFAFAITGGRTYGQQEGTRQWRFFVGGYVTFSSPALSPDGTTVYVGVETDTGGRVIAVAREGGSRWGRQGEGRVLSSPVDSSPAVGPDGTVYIGGVNGTLYALNPANGASYWELFLGGYISSSPAVSADGSTIYVGAADGRLHALTSSGGPKWTFATGGYIESSPAIGPDGTIYFGSHDRNFYAVSPEGERKWVFPTGGQIFSSPAIGADGTIYFGSRDQRLYAVTPAGIKKWDHMTNGPIDASPSLGADGTIYFASDRSFYALRPDDGGERERWKIDIRTGSISSAAIRGDGTIIFGADDGVVRAFDPNGGKKWEFNTETGQGNLIESSPIVALDGSIYIGSFDGHLYKINGNGSPLSALSSWPAFRRDVRHTAQARASNAAGQLANISTRAQAGGGRNLIAGFVVQSQRGRAYLVRAIGPGLADAGVDGFMPDPRLELFSGSVSIRTNDNWLEKDEVSGFPLPEAAVAVQAFPLQTGSKDAAILPGFESGVYTASLSSADGRPGVALVEVYDVLGSGDPTSRLLNLSTRAFVGTGESILIAGFVVRDAPMQLLLRGIGPGLAQFGVPGVLPEPRLTVFRGATPVASNVNWTNGHRNDLMVAGASVAAFPLVEGRADSALLFNAQPGPYTIQISGAGTTTGEAMAEIYVLP
jgi:outer membrane protein assembly factor BamB